MKSLLNKSHIREYNRLLTRYKRYTRKLRRIENGTSNYSRKSLLIKRLKRIYEQLLSLSRGLKLATSGAAFSLGLVMATPTIGTSQNLSLKSDNPVGIINIEKRAKPVLLDWDGDGDLDLFVGGTMENVLDSLSNGVRYYQNDGGALRQTESPFPMDLQTPAIAMDTSAVSPAFVDLDGDDDMDAFLGLQNGTLIYFRNDAGSMVRVDGMENPFDGIVIGGSTYASPTFVDVDGDGDMDAVIGKQDGLLSYYNNDGGVFTEVSSGSPFESVNVTEAAAPTFADWDGDGDMDLIVGNKDGILDYYVNEGGVYTAAAIEANPFSHIKIELFSAPVFGDVDGDNDLDLIVGNDEGILQYYRNDPDSLMQIPFNTLGIGYDQDLDNINHGLVDIDADGDMDLFSGELLGSVLHYENADGVFNRIDPHPLDTSLIPALPDGPFDTWVPAPSFADIDQDGDMDAFIGTFQNNIGYFANEAGVFTADEANNPFMGIDLVLDENENIAFLDWDGDGDMDAFIGNKLGEVKYYQNDDGVFSSAAGPLDGVSFVGPRLPNWSTKPAFADVDGDGDMDAYIGTQDGFIRIFNNDGAGNLTEMTGADNPFEGMDFGRSTAPDFADLDGDGDMDLLVSNSAGLTFHFENTGSVAVQKISYADVTAVYPNPTLGGLQVDMPWLKGKAVISVTNLSGQLLKQVIVNSSRANFDISNLPSGLYLVRINAENGQAVKKIMKG